MKLFRSLISVATASSFLASCQLVPFGNQAAPATKVPGRLKVTQSEIPAQPSDMGTGNVPRRKVFRPHPDRFTSLPLHSNPLKPQTPYRGGVTIRVNSRLAQSFKNSSAYQLMHASNKHGSNDVHGAHNQELYFDIDKLPQGVDPNEGNVPVPGEPSLMLGVSEINGVSQDTIVGRVNILLREGAQSALGEIVSKYNAKVVSSNLNAYTLDLDLSKASLAGLQTQLSEYNSNVEPPVTEINYSSISAAQTMAAMLDITSSHAEEILHISPASIDLPPYVNDTGKPSMIKAGTIAGVSSNAINTVEGDKFNSSGTNENHALDIPWVSKIQLPQAWAHSVGTNVKVAVIDSGFSLDRLSDIASGRITYSPSASEVNVEFSGDSQVARNHGSYSVSTIAADLDNRVGAVGVAPRCQIVAYRAFNPDNVAKAIDKAVSDNVDIILPSVQHRVGKLDMFFACFKAKVAWWLYKTPYDYTVLICGDIARAIYNAHEKGIVVVGSAGNYNMSVPIIDSSDDLRSENIEIPASINPTIAVGATTLDASGNYTTRWKNDDTVGLNKGSCFGEAVDLYAPGVNLEVSGIGETARDSWSGTSASAPVVAGVAALMLSVNPDLPPGDLDTLLKTTVTHRASDDKPLVNALGAVGATRSMLHPIDRDWDAIQLTGRFVDQGDKHSLFQEIDTEHYYWVTPQVPVDSTKQATITGWKRAGSVFEAITVRETPHVLIGYAVNAYYGTSMPGVSVSADLGTTVNETTDSMGRYVFYPGEPGTYRVSTSSPGQAVSITNRILVDNNSPYGDHRRMLVTIPPIVPANNYSVFVLTWAGIPADLDSHLAGPTETGDLFHVFWGNKEHLGANTTAYLLRDAQQGFGPEVIVNRVHPGTAGDIRYAVHDYTNRLNFDSTALSNSQAMVRVFQGDQMVREVSPTPGRQGNVWLVLKMNGLTQSVTAQNDISPANSVSDSASVLQ